jgi:hypothetical protein
MAAMAISLFSTSTFGNGTGAAWREAEAWRAKQKQHTADFEAFNTSLVSTLTSTSSAAKDGLIEITVRKALAAAQQRATERAKLNRVDLEV